MIRDIDCVELVSVELVSRAVSRNPSILREVCCPWQRVIEPMNKLNTHEDVVNVVCLLPALFDVVLSKIYKKSIKVEILKIREIRKKSRMNQKIKIGKATK